MLVSRIWNLGFSHFWAMRCLSAVVFKMCIKVMLTTKLSLWPMMVWSLYFSCWSLWFLFVVCRSFKFNLADVSGLTLPREMSAFYSVLLVVFRCYNVVRPFIVYTVVSSSLITVVASTQDVYLKLMCKRNAWKLCSLMIWCKEKNNWRWILWCLFSFKYKVKVGMSSLHFSRCMNTSDFFWE